MKMFMAALATETNTFSSTPTLLEDFDCIDGDKGEFVPYFQAVRNRAKERGGWTLTEGLGAIAAPAGRTKQSAFEFLKQEILQDLTKALPVDGVVLALHGAMVAEKEEDCEGNILEAVRQIVGPNIPIGVGLDAHAHLTKKMENSANFLVFMKEWPHIDALNIVIDAFDLTADVAEGIIKNPVTCVYDCNMIAPYHTLEEPMRQFIDDMKKEEKTKGVLSISLIHWFDAADVADMGSKILVTTDGNKETCAALAKKFGTHLFTLRGRTAPTPISTTEMLDKLKSETKLPVLIADVADVPGGGAPGDSTFILEALVREGVREVIISSMWDPTSLDIAKSAGVGATLPLKIGGKDGPYSGEPVELPCTVKSIFLNNKSTDPEGATFDDGDTVIVHSQGIDIVLKNKRSAYMVFEPLEEMGLNVRKSAIIVVKSANNFYAGFKPIAGSFYYVTSPGLGGTRLEDRVYKNIKRPKWPFDKT